MNRIANIISPIAWIVVLSYLLYSFILHLREAYRRFKIDRVRRKFRKTVKSDEYQNMTRTERLEYLFGTIRTLRKI